MTGFIGIDVAKDSFTAAFLITNKLNIAQETILSFSVDQNGWQSFMKTWQSLPAQNWIVGLEASGPYSQLLLRHLQTLPYPVHMLSPLQVRKFRQSQSLRKTKTDPIDAHTIALFLHHQHLQGSLKPTPLSSSLRHMVRLQEQLTNQLVRVQNQFRQTLYLLFPELERRFARFPKAIRRLLACYPSAKQIAKANPDHIRTLLAQGQGSAPAISAAELQDLASSSLGLEDQMASLHLKHLLALWESLEKQHHEVSHTLQAQTRLRYPQAWQIMTQIPGLGPNLVARFLALVEDPNRFPSRKALIAYAGLDPSVHQSGRFQATSRLSKRGDPLLRKVLFLMAQALIRYTHRFHQVFQYYRQQGRRYREAVMIVARKVLVVLYALWTRMTPFQDTAPESASL